MEAGKAVAGARGGVLARHGVIMESASSIKEAGELSEIVRARMESARTLLLYCYITQFSMRTPLHCVQSKAWGSETAYRGRL